MDVVDGLRYFLERFFRLLVFVLYGVYFFYFSDIVRGVCLFRVRILRRIDSAVTPIVFRGYGRRWLFYLKLHKA